MKSKTLLLLSSLLPFISQTATATKTNTTSTLLNPADPIYLGDVFWPPTMTFIAWLPSDQNKPNEWCYRATDASNHMLFSLGGVDALQVHNYFDDQAYVTREGKKFADCRVTPESGRMGACEGVAEWECEGKQKFTGPGTRRWSCWVVEGEREKLAARREDSKNVKEEGDGLTSLDSEVTKTVVNAASAASAGVTGR